MVQDLYGELGCYYYCDDILVNAFGLDEIQEILMKTGHIKRFRFCEMVENRRDRRHRRDRALRQRHSPKGRRETAGNGFPLRQARGERPVQR